MLSGDKVTPTMSPEGRVVILLPPDGALDVFDYDTKRQIDLSEAFTEGAKVSLVIQAFGVWKVASRIGTIWKAVNVCVRKQLRLLLSEYAMISDSEEEENDFELR
jgi:hypothetical protein